MNNVIEKPTSNLLDKLNSYELQQVANKTLKELIRIQNLLTNQLIEIETLKKEKQEILVQVNNSIKNLKT